jgi:hypothetical protein
MPSAFVSLQSRFCIGPTIPNGPFTFDLPGHDRHRRASRHQATQSRTVMSYDADATSCPASEKATAVTSLEWPSNVLRHVPVAASHSRTVLSSDADATSCPSGEKATAVTSLEWPSSVLRQASQSVSFIDRILTSCGTLCSKVRRMRLVFGANTIAEQ